MARCAREKLGGPGSTAVGLWAIIPAKIKNARLGAKRKKRGGIQ
jgi:hypothetical protein